jgi:N6-L-threonylcarbamoyladenine synthase
MHVLGIETSCDETAAAVVDDERPAGERILGEAILSQHEEHRPYQGIVPEIAARSHLQHVDRLVAEAMDKAGVGFTDLDGIAATGGPGLIGGVIVGVMSAKAMALVHGLPFLAVNHLAGHALTARLTDDLEFPYLLLLVSGGHTQLLIVEGVDDFTRLGTTVDDAIGEAFDKSAKMLGLGYPGGPAVEAAAAHGTPGGFDLPRPMLGRPDCHFSFSGLKTAVRRQAEAIGEDQVDDLCASLEQAIGEVVADRCRKAINEFRSRHPHGDTLVVAGGVAANRTLRRYLQETADGMEMRLIAPPPKLCTDNGAMIAWAGLERLRLGLTDELDFKPRPRWPLDPDALPAHGAGVKA